MEPDVVQKPQNNLLGENSEGVLEVPYPVTSVLWWGMHGLWCAQMTLFHLSIPSNCHTIQYPAWAVFNEESEKTPRGS